MSVRSAFGISPTTTSSFSSIWLGSPQIFSLDRRARSQCINFATLFRALRLQQIYQPFRHTAVPVVAAKVLLLLLLCVGAKVGRSRLAFAFSSRAAAVCVQYTLRGATHTLLPHIGSKREREKDHKETGEEGAAAAAKSLRQQQQQQQQPQQQEDQKHQQQVLRRPPPENTHHHSFLGVRARGKTTTIVTGHVTYLFPLRLSHAYAHFIGIVCVCVIGVPLVVCAL